MDMDKHFSPSAARTVERLKIAMEARQMTTADISREINISRAALSHYLRGHYTPKYDSILLLSKALNVSHLWLMGLSSLFSISILISQRAIRKCSMQ